MSIIYIRGRVVEAWVAGALVLTLPITPGDDATTKAAIARAQSVLESVGKRGKVCQTRESGFSPCATGQM